MSRYWTCSLSYVLVPSQEYLLSDATTPCIDVLVHGWSCPCQVLKGIYRYQRPRPGLGHSERGLFRSVSVFVSCIITALLMRRRTMLGKAGERVPLACEFSHCISCYCANSIDSQSVIARCCMIHSSTCAESNSPKPFLHTCRRVVTT